MAAFAVPAVPFVGQPRAGAPVVSPLAGSDAPDLSRLELVSGPAPQPGRWRLVVFFASWCRPCLDELVALERLHAGGRVEVVSVITREDPGPARRLFAERGLSWTLLGDDDGAVADEHLVVALPTAVAVAVDPGGVVAAVLLGGVDPADVEALTGP